MKERPRRWDMNPLAKQAPGNRLTFQKPLWSSKSCGPSAFQKREQKMILQIDCQLEVENSFLSIACVHTQLCLTLCNPMDCSPRGSAVLEIFQARIPEWVAISPPGNLPNPGSEPASPASSALAGRFITTEPPGKPFLSIALPQKNKTKQNKTHTHTHTHTHTQTMRGNCFLPPFWM